MNEIIDKIEHIKEFHHSYMEHGRQVNVIIKFSNEPSDKALHAFAIQLKKMILIADKKEA